jgi:hypothetical protein
VSNNVGGLPEAGRLSRSGDLSHKGGKRKLDKYLKNSGLRENPQEIFNNTQPEQKR